MLKTGLIPLTKRVTTSKDSSALPPIAVTFLAEPFPLAISTMHQGAVFLRGEKQKRAC